MAHWRMVGRRNSLKRARRGGGLLVFELVICRCETRVQATLQLRRLKLRRVGKNALFFLVRIGADEKRDGDSSHSKWGKEFIPRCRCLLNEELEADWSRIRVEARRWTRLTTIQSGESRGPAEARRRLAEWERYRKMGRLPDNVVTAAAQQWNGGCGELPGGKGRGVHRATGRRATLARSRMRRATDTAGGSEVEGREELHVDWETDHGGSIHRRKTNGSAQFVWM